MQFGLDSVSKDEHESLRGWLPIDAVVREGRPGLLWMDMRDVHLSEPFFQQTVARLRAQLPERREKFTEFDAVLQLEKISKRVEPTGFIFHASRCGSTLVANVCRALDDAVVVSEANAIDKLAGRFTTDTKGERARELLYSVLLRGVVGAFAQSRLGNERRFFVKFSCCSVLYLSHIRRIWPAVPILFLYRDPTETIVSNLSNVPEWILDPDRRLLLAMLKCSAEELALMSQEELCARAIASFYESASNLAKGKMMLLNYNQLSLSVLLSVVKFFGVSPANQELDAITRVSLRYSKDVTSERAFVADADTKQMRASELVRLMSERWAVEPYRRLEQMRTEVSDSAAAGTS
jgi:hypothetical protein